jgi:hypothetical protein
VEAESLHGVDQVGKAYRVETVFMEHGMSDGDSRFSVEGRATLASFLVHGDLVDERAV